MTLIRLDSKFRTLIESKLSNKKYLGFGVCPTQMPYILAVCLFVCFLPKYLPETNKKGKNFVAYIVAVRKRVNLVTQSFQHLAEKWSPKLVPLEKSVK